MDWYHFSTSRPTKLLWRVWVIVSMLWRPAFIWTPKLSRWHCRCVHSQSVKTGHIISTKHLYRGLLLYIYMITIVVCVCVCARGAGLLQRCGGPAGWQNTDHASAHPVWAAHYPAADWLPLLEGSVLQWVSCWEPQTENGTLIGTITPPPIMASALSHSHTLLLCFLLILSAHNAAAD